MEGCQGQQQQGDSGGEWEGDSSPPTSPSSPPSSPSLVTLRPHAIPNGGLLSPNFCNLSPIPSSEDLAKEQNGEELPDGLNLPIPARLLSQRRCSQSFIDAKEHTIGRLMAQLSRTESEMKMQEEEMEKLVKLKGDMTNELEELTATLFIEANKMVQDARAAQDRAEKQLKEAELQNEVLRAQVEALKYQVITSTPSRPNRHLHPQINNSSNSSKTPTSSPPSSGGGKKTGVLPKPFWKKQRKSTSHHDCSKENQEQEDVLKTFGISEVDKACREEFVHWRSSPCITDRSSPFLTRVTTEDITPCLAFPNSDLAERVLQCVQRNTLSMEPIPADSSDHSGYCCLSQANTPCSFKIRLKDGEEWYTIAAACRNRIAAVCDFYTYIRYICQNLVKSTDKEMLQQVTRLRLQMAASRLGC